jgi:hypothetical protein
VSHEAKWPISTMVPCLCAPGECTYFLPKQKKKETKS